MKRLLFTLLLSGCLMNAFFAKAQQSENAYSSPTLSDPGSWTMVILPDPQTYVKFERNQGIFELMTGWVHENIDPLNIKMVLCTGDLVEQNNILRGAGKNGNESSLEQWRAIDRSVSRLDHYVPYVLAAGNHDFGYKNVETRHSFYDQYITVDRNPLNQQLLREYYFNANGMPTIANAIFEWVSPTGKPFLFLNLEFAPRNEVLNWAIKTIAQEKYKEHSVIVLTHSYMNAKNERIEKENYPIEDGNYGKAIWEKLIAPSKNVKMIVAGHIGSPDDAQKHIAFRQSQKNDGETVTEMVFNAQALGGGWHGNGGDGWLRYLEFLPDGKTVKVRTFSPLFAISPSTQHLAWRTASYDQFEFTLE
ncbi:metallophosphoesterase [Rapidithrix thailandica]|uniref:Metallophosphoesterase n=1 Tax=Rapidithrix thailandica TaxID=413964 RepID=A0AAW9SEJ8_9BACT